MKKSHLNLIGALVALVIMISLFVATSAGAASNAPCAIGSLEARQQCVLNQVVSEMSFNQVIEAQATDEPTVEPTATDLPTEEPTATEVPTETPVVTDTPAPTVEPPVVTPKPTEKVRIAKGRTCHTVWENQIKGVNHNDVGYRYFDKRPACQRWLWLEHGINYDAYKLANPLQ